MKKILALLLALFCGATLFAARGKTTPSGWFDDYEAAREKARRENKPMLLLFTGSDWCGFCIRLRKNVLEKSDFKGFARKNLILVYIDSPKRTKLPKALVEQNRALKAKFGAGGGVPETLIVSADEEVIGKIGGCPKNPKEYLKRLRAIVRKGGSSGGGGSTDGDTPPPRRKRDRK